MIIHSIKGLSAEAEASITSFPFVLTTPIAAVQQCSNMMTTPTLLVLLGAAIIGHAYAAPELAKHIAATRGAASNNNCANTPGDTSNNFSCLFVKFFSQCDWNVAAGCDATCQRCKSHLLIRSCGHVNKQLLIEGGQKGLKLSE
jgi:hypothetical protein